MFRTADKWSIFSIRNGKAELVHMTPDHRNSVEVEIVKGPGVNDEIILYPGDRVRSGTMVERRK